nr:hypothetical protein [Tanacetum cinerariifolium]
MSLLPLYANPKNRKYQTVTPTLPKSHGPEAFEALYKKGKKPKSKKTPAETKETSTPKLTEGTIKTTPRLEGSLGDKDLEGNKTPAYMKPINPIIADPLSTGAKYQMLEPFSYLMMKLKKVRRISWELVKRWMKILRLLKYNISLLHLRKTSLNHLMLHPLKLQTLIPPVMTFSRNMITLSHSLNANCNTISDLYKGLNIITKLLKEINNAVKDAPVINNKINEAAESFTKISTNITKAHALKHDEELATWAKSFTNMAWNLGFKLLGSVTPTLALTHFPTNVEGENDTNTTAKDPSSHTEGETDANMQEKSEEPKHSTDAYIEKRYGTDKQVEDQKKLVKASSIIHPDLDALIPYTINGEVYYLTDEELYAHIDKEEKSKKAKKKARLFAISKPEVIKVLKRQHTEKVRKSLELKKHKYDNYMWTINSILKPKTITDIKIYLKTKLVVVTVFRGTDGRNFDVHKPFAFDEFGIHELDELREIIPRKKNVVVQDLMNLLSPRWSDIDKVRMKALMSYLVAASMVQAPENARLCLKLKTLIAKHLDQEKLKSKKVKLEALGYKMN